MPLSILTVFGTRPEAVKLCPLVLELKQRPEFTVRVCVSGQHRSLLDPVLSLFGVEPEMDLAVMQPDQTLNGLAARILERMDAVLAHEPPQLVLVQGDTTTAMATALACFHRRIPVGHVEAGLRTGDLTQPFPEELNRVLCGRIATLHFAPTPRAAETLRSEGVAAGRVTVTGNTGIDALLWTQARVRDGCRAGYAGPVPAEGRRLVLVTAHRRESFGEGFIRIAEAIRRIAARGDVECVYPVHPNPNVRRVIDSHLSGVERVHLIEPLEYAPFVDLMSRATVALTDSGGVQEEAPSLRLPVLVLRDKTERQEAVEAGTARLVGTEPDRIVAETFRLLDDPVARAAMTGVHNPFGDGWACRRIADAIISFFK